MENMRNLINNFPTAVTSDPYPSMYMLIYFYASPAPPNICLLRCASDVTPGILAKPSVLIFLRRQGQIFIILSF